MCSILYRLMLEEIAQGKVMQQVIERVKKITNFFYQSCRLVALMKKHADNISIEEGFSNL